MGVSPVLLVAGCGWLTTSAPQDARTKRLEDLAELRRSCLTYTMDPDVFAIDVSWKEFPSYAPRRAELVQLRGGTDDEKVLTELVNVFRSCNDQEMLWTFLEPEISGRSSDRVEQAALDEDIDPLAGRAFLHMSSYCCLLGKCTQREGCAAFCEWGCPSTGTDVPGEAGDDGIE